MSTIRSRSRWIKVELGILLILLIVAIYPKSPRLVGDVLVQTSPVQRVRALIETTSLQRRIETGDTEAIRQLAFAYDSADDFHHYMIGNAEALLLPLVEEGHVPSIKLLAWIFRNSDPQRSTQLYLLAADLGDETAQHLSLQSLGIDSGDTLTFMTLLHQVQLDRPGWKTSYDRYIRLLEEEARSGNDSAGGILKRIEGMQDTTDA